MKITNFLNEFVRTELLAGLIGALLVIPQAISFSFLAGVAPQFGLYCAIFMGLVASLLGRSPIISGPNTAMVILIGATLVPFAGKGTPLYAQYLALLTLMVALFQLLFYVFRWHRIFDYIHPVTVKAISTSIGVLLIVSSIDGIMGVTPYQTLYFYDKLISLPSTIGLINPFVFCVAAITIVAGLLSKLRWPRYYLAVALGTGLLTSLIIDQLFPPTTTLMDRLGIIEIALMPFHLPKLSNIEFPIYGAMFFPAAVLAYLGLSQTLVIAKDIEAIPDIDQIDVKPSWRKLLTTEISLRKEVLAQALGNITSFFLGSYAGSGSFNRTMVNLDIGSKTKLAGIMSAVFVWLFIMIFGQILNMLPMAVIYGSLCIVGIGMIKGKEIARIMKHPIERWLFLVVIFSLLVLGLSTGIAVALVLSIVTVALLTNEIEWTQDEDNNIHVAKGPLNYVTQLKFKRKLEQLFAGKEPAELKACQLDVSGLTAEQSSYLTPLDDILAPLKAKGITIIRA